MPNIRNIYSFIISKIDEQFLKTIKGQDYKPFISKNDTHFIINTMNLISITLMCCQLILFVKTLLLEIKFLWIYLEIQQRQIMIN